MLFKRNKKRDPIAFWDLHTHILPEMDDGARDVDESLAILSEQIRQGCQGLIATPHYYPQETIRQFAVRRGRAWTVLKAALQAKRPDWQDKILLGAEAAWHPGLCADPDLEMLCLGHSRYLLLEMPFQQWTPAILRDVRTILNIRGITPVIAHLERFFGYTSADSIERLLDMYVIVQMNAGALLSRSLRRQAFRMVKTGIAQVISSDTHNMASRRPDIEYGIQALKDAGLGDQAQEILDRGREIYQEAAEPL